MDRRPPVFESGKAAAKYRRAQASRERGVGLCTCWDHVQDYVLRRRESLRLSVPDATWQRYKEFCINKRDAPFCAEGPLQGLPVMSQYTGPAHADVCVPLCRDYRRALAGHWIGKETRPERESLVPPPQWSTRAPTAVFRGGATGSGVTPATNVRLLLCSMAAQWAGHFAPPLLDAALTSWNPRHKRGADGVIRIVDPSSACPGVSAADVGPHQWLTPRQQVAFRYAVYLDGNVGADRITALAAGAFVVIAPESTAPQPLLRQRMRAWEHYVPVASDLSDLRDKILWCRAHDSEAERMGAALRALAEPFYTSAGIEAEMSSALRGLPPPSMLSHLTDALKYIWDHGRSAIYCLVDERGRVRAFVPFANRDFRNDWGHEAVFSSGSLQQFLQEAETRFGREEGLISDPRLWWDNAGLICNVMHKNVWSDTWEAELRFLLERSGAIVAAPEIWRG